MRSALLTAALLFFPPRVGKGGKKNVADLVDITIYIKDKQPIKMRGYAASYAEKRDGYQVQLQDIKIPGEKSTLRWSRWHAEVDIDDEKVWTWEQVKAQAQGKRGRPPKQ